LSHITVSGLSGGYPFPATTAAA